MTFDRKRYARLYARRQRAAKLDAERRERDTCPRRMGPGVCGGKLDWKRAGDRSWKRSCPRCERREAGICQDCDRPVEGTILKALRCAEHKHARMLEHGAAFVKKHYAKVRKKWRRYHKRVAQQKAAYKRLWRKANPEKVKAQKRREALRRNAHTYEYHRAYRMAAEIEGRNRYRVGPRPCLGGCGVIVAGRAKKCQDCKRRAQREALLKLGRAA